MFSIHLFQIIWLSTKTLYIFFAGLVKFIIYFPLYFNRQDAPTQVYATTSLHRGDVACDPLHAAFHKIRLFTSSNPRKNNDMTTAPFFTVLQRSAHPKHEPIAREPDCCFTINKYTFDGKKNQFFV